MIKKSETTWRGSDSSRNRNRKSSRLSIKIADLKIAVWPFSLEWLVSRII